MFTDIFLVASLIFIMEIGDKTGLLVIALSSRSNKPGAVFFGSFLALSFMAFLAALFGYLLQTFVTNTFALNILVGLIFIGTGLIILLRKEDHDAPLEEQNHSSNRSPLAWFFKAFFLVGSAEFMDKTQLTVVALIPLNGFMNTVLGAMLGFAFITSLEILIGDQLRKSLPEKWIHYGTVLLFIITGVIVILLQFLSPLRF